MAALYQYKAGVARYVSVRVSARVGPLEVSNEMWPLSLV